MNKLTDKFTIFCNECDWKEETTGLPYQFCPKCGHVNIGFSQVRERINLIGKYNNGNYTVEIYDDGTKIRETIDPDDTEFIAIRPECMDVKITNYCDMSCPYCHENSNKDGKHGEILNLKFIDTLNPYTELAIGGGNPLSHPDLEQFLEELRNKHFIANMTINQTHFMSNIIKINTLISTNLIKGLGISLTKVTDEFISSVTKYPDYSNAVIHVINGIIDLEELRKLYNKGLKILILGYKEFRRGAEYYSEEVETNKKVIYDNLVEIVKGFKVVSFDNLALKQLDVRRIMSKAQWDKFYMGDDGSHTMYIDLVEKKYAKNSTSPIRLELSDDIKDMFYYVKNEDQFELVDNQEKYEEELTAEDVKRIIDEAPDRCPISGMDKCESYIIGRQAVYLTVPAYDAYTLPVYNEEERCFDRTHYDMDDDNREEFECMCCLDELKDREDYEDIKKFYNIKED